MTSENRIALVTGAGSGVGRASALGLHAAGFQVVLTGRRAEELEKTAAMAQAGKPVMVAVPADVSQPDSVSALFEKVERTYGRLDVLFNNAGKNAPAVPMDELPVNEWFDLIAVNLSGAFLCAREAIRLMKKQTPRGGRIINNGSISAHVPRPYSAPYTASKHAITGLTKSIALDCREHDIACGQIDIGNAATEMTERMTAGVLQPDGSKKVEPRINAKHVADAVVYMASLPLDANVPFITVMATKMPLMGRG